MISASASKPAVSAVSRLCGQGGGADQEQGRPPGAGQLSGDQGRDAASAAGDQDGLAGLEVESRRGCARAALATERRRRRRSALVADFGVAVAHEDLVGQLRRRSFRVARRERSRRRDNGSTATPCECLDQTGDSAVSRGRSRRICDPLAAKRPPMAVAAIRHDPPARAALSRSEAAALASRKRPLHVGADRSDPVGLGGRRSGGQEQAAKHGRFPRWDRGNEPGRSRTRSPKASSNRRLGRGRRADGPRYRLLAGALRARPRRRRRRR